MADKHEIVVPFTDDQRAVQYTADTLDPRNYPMSRRHIVGTAAQAVRGQLDTAKKVVEQLEILNRP